MKKRILSFITSALTVLTVITMLVVPVSAYEFSPEYGQYLWFRQEISSLGNNTQIRTLKKTYPKQNFSKVQLDSSSTVNQMDLWVSNVDRDKVSQKVRAYPDNNVYTIKYKTDITFLEGAQVVLWGEQNNVAKKTADGTFFCY